MVDQLGIHVSNADAPPPVDPPTAPEPPEPVYGSMAVRQSPRHGRVVAGRLESTCSPDEDSEGLQESASFVLDHTWKFELGESVATTFEIDTLYTASEGVFWVRYSTDRINYRNMLTLSALEVDTCSYSLPDGITGTLSSKCEI